MKLRCLVFVLALLGALGSDSWGQSKQPPQAQGVQTDQQTYGAKKGQQNPAQQDGQPANSVATVPQAVTPELKKEGQNNTNHSAEEVSEYWPFLIFGTKLKITDSLLALFTFCLVVIGAWQGRELRRTVSSIIRQERPFLRPTEITSFLQAGDNFEANKTALMSYRLENYGRTPAILTEVRVEVVIRTEVPNPMKTMGLPIYHQEVVKPDKSSREFYGTSVVDIGDSDMRTVFKKTAGLYFTGFVRYRDVYDRKRITVFCWQYDYAMNSFFPVRSKRHNYTK
jgi:hypothetical protein